MKKKYYCVSCKKKLEIEDPFVWGAVWVKGVVVLNIECKICKKKQLVEIDDEKKEVEA